MAKSSKRARRPAAKKAQEKELPIRKAADKKAAAKQPGKGPARKSLPFANLQRALGWPEGRQVVERIPRDDHNAFRIIVEAARGATPAALRAHLGEVYGEVRLERLFPRYVPGEDIPSIQDFYLATLPGISADRLIANPFDIAYAGLKKGIVAGAEPDIGIQAAPSGPCKSRDAKVNENRRWTHDQMRIAGAWARLAAAGKDRGGGILVGQPDTGFTFHKHMLGKFDMLRGHDFISDSMGGVDPLPDQSRINGEFPGHGTATASIIVASDPTDGQDSMSGIAPEAMIAAMRVTRSVIPGMQFSSLLAQGIDRARREDCRILSISLGGFTANAVHCAIRNAYAHNMLICCAAGQCTPVILFPANYPESIACGGSRLRVGDNGEISESYWKPSAWGPIDIAASAEMVWDCMAGGTAGTDGTPDHPFNGLNNTDEGTSFAAPAVAAVGALWLKFNEDKDLRGRYRGAKALNWAFRKVLADTARRPDGWTPRRWGPGIVDADAVLAAPLPDPGPSVPFPTFLMATDRVDYLDLWCRMFWDQSRDNVRRALMRLLGAVDDADLQARLKQFGLEMQSIIAGAPERFETLRRAIAADAGEAAHRVAEAAQGFADRASQKLRSVFP